VERTSPLSFVSTVSSVDALCCGSVDAVGCGSSRKCSGLLEARRPGQLLLGGCARTLMHTRSLPKLAAAAGFAVVPPCPSPLCIDLHPRLARAAQCRTALGGQRWRHRRGSAVVRHLPIAAAHRPFLAPRGRCGLDESGSAATLNCMRVGMRLRLPNCMRVAFRERMALRQSTGRCREARARSTAVLLAHNAAAGQRPLFAQRR